MTRDDHMVTTYKGGENRFACNFCEISAFYFFRMLSMVGNPLGCTSHSTEPRSGSCADFRFLMGPKPSAARLPAYGNMDKKVFVSPPHHAHSQILDFAEIFDQPSSFGQAIVRNAGPVMSNVAMENLEIVAPRQ